MDDLFNKTYAAEAKTGTILNIFAVLTILVACLGLFGLVTYTAEQRTKEIGIRKVLGASVMQVTEMLSKDFIKLVAIACVIAFPLSYWAMTKWLQGFAYRISISWWIFVVAGFAAIIIALATVSFQAIKAAIANPVKSLRTE
jgi:putative ABC transport system permease protein